MESRQEFSFFDAEKNRKYLLEACRVSEEAVRSGNTPFGAILVDGEGNILLRQENVEITRSDCTGHAETTLCRVASGEYSREFLATCSLYTTAEPCAMCSGAIYWANIGRVVYGISEKELLELTGSDPQNPTFDLPCREVFAAGQKDLVVEGPTEDQELKDLLKNPHMGFWNK